MGNGSTDMDARRSETWFFVASLAIAIFVTWLIFAPYLSVLVLVGVLAFLFKPVYQRFLRLFRYESVAAFSTVVVVALVVFVPLGFFALRIFEDATALYVSLASHGGFDFGAALTKALHTHFASLPVPDITFNFNDYVRQGLSWLIQNLGLLFSGLAQIFFTALLGLLGLFYFLKDGDRLKQWALGIVPLAPEYTEGIVREMEAVGSSVIKGTLVVAILQGILMGLGFLLFNIPDPTFWGALVMLASIIPIVGPWLVVVPAIAYLFLIGQTAAGIGLLVWGAILVNLVYNVIAPQLMHRGANLHPYFILLSVLGGIGLFGPIGLLLGPLVTALLFYLLKIYTKLIIQHD